MFFCCVESGQVGAVTLLLVPLFDRHKYWWESLLPCKRWYGTAAGVAVTLLHIGMEGLCFAAVNLQITDAADGAVRPECPLLGVPKLIVLLFLLRFMRLVTAFRSVIRYFRHAL